MGTVATLSPRQQAIRAEGLGASEIGTALGLNPFQAAAELAAVKRGELPPFEGNQFTKWGQRLERSIADEWLERHRAEGEDVSIFTPGTLRHPTCQVLVASPDRIVVPEGRRAREVWREVLEIKSLSAYRAAEFADGIPEVYEVQVQAQLEVTGLERGTLVPLLGGNDYREIPIARDRETGGMLVQFAEKWWSDHVVQGLPIPVDGTEASASYLRRRFPAEHGPMLPPSEEAAALVKRVRELKAAAKAAEEAESAASNLLRQMIGEAAGIEGAATWKANRPSPKTDWEAAARDLFSRLSGPMNAPLFDEIVKLHTTSKPGARVLRLLGAKE